MAAGPWRTGLAGDGEGSAAGYAGDRDRPGLFIGQGEEDKREEESRG